MGTEAELAVWWLWFTLTELAADLLPRQQTLRWTTLQHRRLIRAVPGLNIWKEEEAGFGQREKLGCEADPTEALAVPQEALELLGREWSLDTHSAISPGMRTSLEGGTTLTRQFLSVGDSPQRGLTAEGHLPAAFPTDGGPGPSSPG